MAGYRQFHTKFWKDAWVIELAPLERYLFTYLFTNEQSSISGIFELPLRIIMNETGLEKSFIIKSLDKFQSAKKIFYKDNVMWVVKMRQHHQNASPLTMKKVNSDIAWIPECDVKKAYIYYCETGIYSIDMVSIPISLNKDKEEDKEETKDKKNKPAAPPVVFPSSLNCTEFMQAWIEWDTFRSEIKRKLTPSTIDKQLAMLSKYPVKVAIAILNQSIEKGWQGLFELKSNGNGHTLIREPERIEEWEGRDE